MSAKRARGLGKGIDAMIFASEEKNDIEEVVKEVDTIDINKIEPSGNQPRKNFDEKKIHELAESIKLHGLIEPLIVQKGRNGFYTIVAGERRWRAAREAGIREIPVVVREYTAQEMMEIALIENIQREDLNAIEEAQAYNRLIEEFGLRQDEVADRVSKSRVAVTNALRLLKLDGRVRDLVVEDKLKGGHARALLGITDGDEQYKLAMQVVENSLSVRETERLVKKIISEKNDLEKKKKKEAEEKDIQSELVYRDYEEKLKTVIGTKVNINHKKDGKGKIEIEYFSIDEFDRIMEMMMAMK